MSGILRLESLTKGNTLKQGDKTPLKYRLFDADGEKLNIAGKSAQVRLVYPDFLTIGYEKDGLTVAQDDTVTFSIDNVIPSRIYHVEIIVDDKFIFPSRADESKFTVDKSSLGVETNIIEIVGKDVLIREVKQQVINELGATGGGSGGYDDVAVQSHIANRNNPHQVTKAQVGLGNVSNTSDANKPVSTAMQSALNDKADKSQVLTNVPVNAKFTDTTYTAGTGINITDDVISATGEGGTVAIPGPEGPQGPEGPKGDIPITYSATPPLDTDIMWVDETEEGPEGLLNEVKAQLAQISLKKANQIGIDVTNPPNGLTPAKADGVTDDTLAINNILLYAESQGIKNVFIPEGKYRITDSINLFRELKLTLAHNAVIEFSSLTNNVFKMATRSVLTGGKVVTRYDFTGSVFYYRGAVVNSTIDGIKCYGTNFKGTDFRDTNTGTVVHFDGYYPNGTEVVEYDSYCQYNTFKNVYAIWYGTFLKAEVNEDGAGRKPWFTANLFLNIEVERVNQIVYMNVGGANFFDHLRVQCGPEDDLLFYIGGDADINRFTNIFYYDIVEQTQIVEMGRGTIHNYFELWHDGPGYRDRTIDHGYRNRIEAPGAMLEVPKEIPLTAEWVKKTGIYPEPRVFKTKEGIVHIEGVVTNLTETTGEPFNGLIGVLPVGYRPKETVIYSVPSGPVTQTNVLINHSNGEIRAYENVSDIYLNGIAPYRA